MANKGNYKHGYYGTRIYKSWAEMKYRCENENKKYYNSISYCERWKDFKNFLADMGKRPKDKTLDRIDNNKRYCFDNCRWATPTQQARNRRNTHLFRGKTLSEWSEILGVNRSTLAERFYVYGWSIDKTLSVKRGY